MVNLDDLDPGLYMVTVGESQLSVYSTSGVFVGVLARGVYSGPAVSPDQQTIVFNAEGGRLAFQDIRSGMRNLYEPFDRLRFDPWWSPDGEWVLITEVDEVESIVPHLGIIHYGTMASEQITFWPEGEHTPAWSPDGRWIAFASSHGFANMASGIFLIDGACIETPDTCAKTIEGPLAGDGDVSMWEPSWSPESRRIVATCAKPSEPDGMPSICMFDMESQSVEWILESSESGVRPRWSPESDLIAFQRDYGGGVYLVRPDGSDERLISLDDRFGFWLRLH